MIKRQLVVTLNSSPAFLLLLCAASSARPEDITMTQDLSEIGRGIEFDEMQFGSIEQEIEMGDGFADVSLDLEGQSDCGGVERSLKCLSRPSS